MLRGASGPDASSSHTADAPRLVPDRLVHQRGCRGQDEAVSACCCRELKQLSVPVTLTSTKACARVPRDVGLMERGGVHHASITVVGEQAL
jgi:hypothetical protein